MITGKELSLNMEAYRSLDAQNMPEGTLQLEHLLQAAKLLQLKKGNTHDIEVSLSVFSRFIRSYLLVLQIICDVCWMLSPTQIQKLISNYAVADYEVKEIRLNRKWK